MGWEEGRLTLLRAPSAAGAVGFPSGEDVAAERDAQLLPRAVGHHR